MASTAVVEVVKGLKGEPGKGYPTQTWGDVTSGVKYGESVPTSKAVVSLTNNTFDGLDTSNGSLNYVTYHPAALQEFAEVNWNSQTLGPYGSAFLNYSKANGVSTCFEFTTVFEGTYFLAAAYKIPNIQQDFRIWIDDQEVTSWFLGSRATGVQQTNQPIITYNNDSTIGAININFAVRGIYKIRVSGIACSGTTGIIGHNKEGKIHKPAKQRTFGIISDSWYDTIAGSTSLNGATELAARLGMNQWNMANGGSGMSNPQNLTTSYKYKDDAVFASLAKAPELDFLLLNGSANDLAYSNAQVTADMQAFFTRWRTVRPNTPIIWQGIEPASYFETTMGYTAAYMTARENLLASVALADQSVLGVIRPSLENWLTGTGYITAPNGTGNQDFNTGPDMVHLSKWGTTFNGAMVYNRICGIPTWRQAT